MPNDKKQKVLDVLKKVYPEDLLPRDIARKAGISRQTASVKLQILEAEGKIEAVRRLGRAVWYRYKE